MANYNTLKTDISSVIRQNDNNEITGQILQQSLLSMVNSLGAGYQFMGVATPATNPGTPDQKVFYLATIAGNYSNFDGIVLNENEAAILKYNGNWAKDILDFATKTQIENLIKTLGEKIIAISTTENIKDNAYINTSGYIEPISAFIASNPYDLYGVEKIKFKGYAGSTYYSYAFYDNLGKFISGNTLPSSITLIDAEINIPETANHVIFSTAKSRINDFSVSIEYNDIGIKRAINKLNERVGFIERNFQKTTITKVFGELFSGTLYNFSTYCYTLVEPIYGALSNVSVKCNNGANITIYKYDRLNSSLVEIGNDTAAQDGILTIDCNNVHFNGEFIAFKSSSQLEYRPMSNSKFGVVFTTGAYKSDSTYEYSILITMASEESLTVQTMSVIEKGNKTPINSDAVFDIKKAIKVKWESGTMTSAGTIYNNPSFVHSEYIKANSFFEKNTIYFDSSVYAWVFFDKYLYPLGGFRPTTSGYVEINGSLSNIPDNAEYVVINQDVSLFKDIYVYSRDTIKSRWNGKNVLFIGDSFIDQEELPKQICALLGCNGINRGISGSVVASKGGASYQSLVDRLDGYNDDTNPNEKYHSFPASCDAVIINCSTNDYGTSIPMGAIEMGFSVKTTFYGGVHYVINKLVEKYGNIPIIWINATHRYTSNKPEFTINQDGTFTITKNDVNCSLLDYVNALENVCNSYSIPVVDVYRKSRIQPLFAVNKNAYTIDGLHPNDAGSKLMALRVLEAIEYIGY